MMSTIPGWGKYGMLNPPRSCLSPAWLGRGEVVRSLVSLLATHGAGCRVTRIEAMFANERWMGTAAVKGRIRSHKFRRNLCIKGTLGEYPAEGVIWSAHSSPIATYGRATVHTCGARMGCQAAHENIRRPCTLEFVTEPSTAPGADRVALTCLLRKQW